MHEMVVHFILATADPLILVFSSGMVVFLEEDHYVAEDFIHVLNLLRSTADKSCPHCEILCLGTYLKTYQYHSNGDKVMYPITIEIKSNFK